MVIESLLTPLMGEELPKPSDASNLTKADVSVRGLLIHRQTTFCDVRVFNSLVKCHLHCSLSAVHKNNENEKKQEYNQRMQNLQVEHGSFTPLVFSCFGGMSRECNRFFSHTAGRLAKQKKRT